jgi:hypothetical protein
LRDKELRKKKLRRLGNQLEGEDLAHLLEREKMLKKNLKESELLLNQQREERKNTRKSSKRLKDFISTWVPNTTRFLKKTSALSPKLKSYAHKSRV